MYYRIYCKDMDCSEGMEPLIGEKMEVVEQLLTNYPPDSIIARVTFRRLPVTHEYYDVRIVLELPGDVLYARSSAEKLETGLIDVASELERQVKQLLSQKRNETDWKRHDRPSETIRETVPVDEEELLDIQDEVQQRTEQQRGHGPTRRAA